jgi:rfaE bifunctional protein kinase chain/domain
VVMSDYCKNVFTREIIFRTITSCKKKKIPVIVDTKSTDCVKFGGATVLKTNLGEFKNLMPHREIRHIKDVMDSVLIVKALGFEHVVVTLGEEGIAYNIGEEVFHADAIRHDVIDVTGAGDIVTAVLALGAASKQPLDVQIPVANYLAGVSVTKHGVWNITKEFIEGIQQ